MPKLFVVFTSVMVLTIKGLGQIDGETFNLELNGNHYQLKGYNVYERIDEQWQKMANFVEPTVSLLLDYRPEVKQHFAIDENEDEHIFFDAVNEIVSVISTSIPIDDKIWVGFSFYEGEGWEGYGGVGFFDTRSKRLGVLRHPALINCSVRLLYFSNNKLFVATMGYYELSTDICNGLVVIDLITAEAKSFKPRQWSTLWHKDDEGKGLLKSYDRPIEELIHDSSFVETEVENFNADIRKRIQQIGLEQFMIEENERERLKRSLALTNANMVKNETVIIDSAGWRGIQKGQDSYYAEITTHRYVEKGCFFKVILSLNDYEISFSADTTNVNRKSRSRHIPETFAGSSFNHETSKYVFKVILEDFAIVKKVNTYNQIVALFDWVRLNVRVYEIIDFD